LPEQEPPRERRRDLTRRHQDGGLSRWLTLKSVVEFAAALIAVIGGIVAFIKWIL
jgi:hypothetical protein